MKKLITVIALSAVGGVALAQAPVPGDSAPTTPSANFQKLDTNRDGALSKIEVSGDNVLTNAFSSVDKNADGKIDANEYRAAMTK